MATLTPGGTTTAERCRAGALFALALLAVACGDDASGQPAASEEDPGDPFANADPPEAPSSPATPGGGGDGCLTEFAPCEQAATRCCEGFDCVVDEELGTRCRRPCERDGQCEAEACVEAGGGETLYCAYPGEGGGPLPGGECLEAGADDCDDHRPCCSGMVCVTADGSELDGCQPACTMDGDCDSGCCQRAEGRTTGFCAPPRFCSCGENGAACGGFEPDCCEGFTCTLDNPDAASCKPSCEENADCETECCAPVTGTGESACVAAERC